VALLPAAAARVTQRAVSKVEDSTSQGTPPPLLPPLAPMETLSRAGLLPSVPAGALISGKPAPRIVRVVPPATDPIGGETLDIVG
jgi:hypothetical protein